MRTVAVAVMMAVSMPVLAQDAPKKLTADDLAVETHKWDGKQVQTTAQCFYADKDEYRCMALGASGIPAPVRIDFMRIDPPDMQKYVEDNCDTVQRSFTRTCRYQITFKYSRFETQEHTDGSRVMLIAPEDFSGTFAKR